MVLITSFWKAEVSAQGERGPEPQRRKRRESTWVSLENHQNTGQQKWKEIKEHAARLGKDEPIWGTSVSWPFTTLNVNGLNFPIKRYAMWTDARPHKEQSWRYYSAWLMSTAMAPKLMWGWNKTRHTMQCNGVESPQANACISTAFQQTHKTLH